MRTTTTSATLVTAALAALAAVAPALPAGAADGGAVPAGTSRPALVVTSDRDGDSEIYSVSSAGRSRKLTRNSAGDWGAVWSPDGRRLAFVSDRDGNADIYVMRADGREVRQLTRTSTTPEGAPVVEGQPAWSPDGQRIAFTSTRDGGESEVYVMDADGTDVQRLTTTEPWVIDGNPDWSPDGKQIAFASNRGDYDNMEIYRMRADGSGVRRVTRTASGIDDTAPSWSPDGRQLAFASTRGGTQDVHVMSATGRGVRLVAGDPVLDEVFPRWTSDGRQIVYWTFSGPEGTPSEDVWAVGSDGQGRRVLLGTAAGESSPDPRPAAR